MIRTKFQAGALILAVSAVPVVVTGTLLFLGLANSRQHEQILRDIISGSDTLVDLRNDYATTKDLNAISKWTNQWQFIDRSVTNSAEHFLKEPELQLFSEFYSLHAERKILFEGLVAAEIRGDSAEANRLEHLSEDISSQQELILRQLNEFGYQTYDRARNAFALLAVIAAAVMLLTALVLLYAGKKVSTALSELQYECTNILVGGTSYWAKIESLSDAPDEIGFLAKAFVSMGKDIRRYQNTMEGLVVKRTAKLDASVNELKKMNKFMVDREVRMAELKLEIQDLKKQLSTK